MASSTVAGIWSRVGGSLPTAILKPQLKNTSLYERNAYPGRRYGGNRVYLTVNVVLRAVVQLPTAILKPQLKITSLYDRNVYPARRYDGYTVYLTGNGGFKITSVYDKNVYPARRYDGYRGYLTRNVVLRAVGQLPTAIFKPQLTRNGVNEEESPVFNCMRGYRNVAQESGHDFRWQGYVCGKALPIGSAKGGQRSIHLPSASTTSEAIVILKHRQQQGLYTDSYMFVEILKRCAKQKDLTAATQVHECIIRSAMDKNPYVATTLLNVYVKCGRLEDARRVFDGLEEKNRNVITWTLMIGEYAKCGCGVEAYRLFLQMQREGFTPNAITYISILNASASAGALEWVKEVHDHARRAGLESDLRVSSALIRMYAKSGSIGEARVVFDRLEKRDVTTWNIMIGAYTESRCGVEAYRLFLQMKREGFTPGGITYMNILNASASAGALEWVKEVHGDIRRTGLDSDLRVGSALIHMYAKSGSIGEARVVFDRLEKRDVTTWNIMIGAYSDSGCGVEAYRLFLLMKREGVEPNGITWTTMIGAYAKSGCGVEAYRLFLQMKREGFTPNAITYMSILNASASAGALEWVKEVHGHARRAGLESDLRVGNALVQMYAKSGSIDVARQVFDRMRKRDVITWTIMIGGLAQHGCGHEALELFRKMNADCVKPDGTSFVAVLSACCHAGLLDDGRRIFSAMKQEYGIEPTVVHYNCMVDLLGRAGLLEEAKLFIGDMPVEPDVVTWGALLGACRTYGNVELAELSFKELLKLEPTNAFAYVLLSNIFAAAGQWEKVSLVRTMMQERGVQKEPGRSWIEVDKKIHEFLVGDTSHPEANAIYSELNNLTDKLRAEGYIPDTQLVLQNIDEEDKELALCSHSERLAIAYGLIHIPHGKPVRVFKNLRVCSDCHTATKLISKVIRREIIVRDANRFHHFKDGVCSCGDYW